MSVFPRSGSALRKAAILLWSCFTFAAVMIAYAVSSGADLSASPVHQIYYGLIYSASAVNLLFKLALACCTVWFAARSLKIAFSSGQSFSVSCMLAALFFTFNILISVSPTGRLQYLQIPGLPFATNLILWVCFSADLYLAILLFAHHFSKPLPSGDLPQPTRKDHLLFGGIILAGWLPFVILLAPGDVWVDSIAQFLEFMGLYPFDASNPIALTFLYGILFSSGYALGSVNIGLFFCVLFQTALLLFALSLGCKEIMSYTGSRAKALFAAVFFAVLPNYVSFAIVVIKDSVYCAFFLLFFLSYLRVLRGGDRKDLVKLILFGILCAATRIAAIYITIACFLALGIYKKGIRRILFSTSAAMLLASIVLSNVILPYFHMGVSPVMQREKYSFFYQLTGYYCSVHKDELTPQEIETIDAVLDYNAVCEEFTTDISDPVKNTFHAQDDPQSIRSFLLLNLKFFIKHPLTCIDALIYTKNLYFSPFLKPFQPMWLFQAKSFQPEYIPFFSYWFGKELAASVVNFRWDLDTVTMIGILSNCGLYTWIPVCFWVVSRVSGSRQKAYAVFPLLAAAVGLLATHMNGAVRYAAPLYVTVPVFLFLFRGMTGEPQAERSARQQNLPGSGIV